MIDLQQEKQNRITLASSQQRQASDPDISVWVEASAGTGKTKVLSDRVLRLLLKGVSPAKILCLTYTKAAAVEMSSRIASRLSNWAIEDETKLINELQKLLGSSTLDPNILAQARKLFAIMLDTPGGMKIQTIHSFCQEILKRFPIEAKISPYFEVMDDRMAKEALESIKKTLIDKIETEPESQTAKALSFITTKMNEFVFPKLMSNLTTNRNKIISILKKYGSAEIIISKIATKLNLNPNISTSDIITIFWQQTNTNQIHELSQAMLLGSETDQKKSAQLLSALAQQDYNSYRKIFITEENEPRKTIATKKVILSYPMAEKFAKEESERILNTDEKLTATNLFASTVAVLHLAEDLLNNYNDFKKLNAKIDYEDLIVQTRNLLENPQVAEWVLYKLDGGIDNVLIDEAQDTSPDQWAIIKSITNDFFYGKSSKEQTRTVFVVGDRKQSIYSFQGADPQEFEKSRQYFISHSSANTPFKEINLDVSFRSTAAILDIVNQLFSEDCAKQGVVAAEQKICHIPARIGEGGKVEIWPLIEKQQESTLSIILPPIERIHIESPSTRLAKKIATTIYNQVNQKELLVSKNRPIEYRDYMILVQRRNDFIDELVRACKNLGIEISGADKISLSEQIAVQDMISIAKFVLLPEDDLSLAEILKSPLFNLSDEDLILLCHNRKHQSLWQRLKNSNQHQNIYSELQQLLSLADNIRPFEFFNYILNVLKGRQKFIARLGHEAEDGIDEFINLTLHFEQEHIPSLQLFIDWIHKDDIEIKREQKQDQNNAVRIMTVHGSKGLQSPIVILPDAMRVKKTTNENDILFDDDIFLYPFNSAEYETTCKKIRNKQQQNALEEYHRLLYVALTRAEDRLYICGYQQESNNNKSWYNLCQNNLDKICSYQQKKLVYEIKQEIPIQSTTDISPKLSSVDPFLWLNNPAPIESPLSKPLTPSKQDNDDDVYSSPLEKDNQKYFLRGTIIHKLLQLLPEISKENRINSAKQYFHNNNFDLSSSNQSQIISEVISILENPEFSSLFDKQSKAEVPIMGEVDGKIISGQIDRLAVLPDKVLIIDYKTNRPAAKSINEVPLAYLKQLKAYKSLVQKIYPDKIIKTYILWTNTTQIMEIE